MTMNDDNKNLEFTDKEWELLKRLRDANGADRNQVVTTNNDDNTRRTQQQKQH